MDARLALLAAFALLAGCQSPSQSGSVVDARKDQETAKSDFLAADPAKQDQGVKGMKGFNRAAPPASLKMAAKQDTEPLGFRPATYFAKNCAACHGKFGAKFDEKAKEKVGEKEFALVVADMAKSKAKEPVFGRELAALVDYTKAEMLGVPYVGWVKDSVYETSSASQVVVRGPGDSRKVSETEIAAKGLKKGSELLVTRGGKSASLMFPAAQSHGDFAVR